MPDTLEEYLMKKADVTATPISGTLELTPLCNLQCEMCYIRHTPEEAQKKGGLLPTEFWLRLIEPMRQAGVLFIGLIGGEVFTYPRFESLYTKLVESGFQLSFTTNGTLLANGLPAWLTENPPRYVTVSLYGSSDETYRRVCKSPDGYTRTVRAIENLMNANIQVKLNFCLVPENAGDLEAVAAFAKQHGLQLLASAYNFPPARKAEHTFCDFARFSPEEAAEQEFKIKKLTYSDAEFENFVQYLAGKNYMQGTPKHVEKFWCRAGRSVFWISWQGYLSPCGMLETPNVDLKQIDFSEAWNKIRQETEAVRLSPRCAACDKREICQSCPAMMMAETSSFSGTPDYVCHLTEKLIDLAVRKNSL